MLPAGLDRIFLSNSGTEAIEAALKLARAATGRTGIVATMRGFHGRTYGALSATWEAHYREPFAPLVEGFQHVPYNNLAALDAAVGDDDRSGDRWRSCKARVACVLAVPSSCGVRNVVPGTWCAADRGRGADRHGPYRTHVRRRALWTSARYSGAGEGTGGGVPIGATAFGPRVGALSPGMHGSTFGGNPLACAAGRAALQHMQTEELPARAARLGEAFIERLRTIRIPTHPRGAWPGADDRHRAARKGSALHA